MDTAVEKLISTLCAVTLVLFLLPGCLIRPIGGSDRSSLTDIDKDGIPNVSDLDIDDDGVINIKDQDIDGDRIPNTQDNDIDGDGVPNIDDDDIDGDGVTNIQDSDIDGDGIPNDQDSDLDGDGIINSEDKDIDGDGIPNSEDPDIDNDSITNDRDKTPGGTGNDIDGTGGEANTGADKNTGETGADDYVSGIGVVAVDTVAYTLTIPPSQGSGTVSTIETIDLKKVRDKIEENNIALPTVNLSGLTVIASGSNDFIEANKDKQIVVTVSYIDEGNKKVPILKSAAADGPVAGVLSVGDLAAGISLNDEIFLVPEGYSSFTSMIKDESKNSVTSVIEITFLDAPLSAGGAELDVHFILRATGIKPL